MMKALVICDLALIVLALIVWLFEPLLGKLTEG